MPGFDDQRDRLRQARADLEAASDALAVSRHELARIAARESELDRVVGANGRQDDGAVERLRRVRGEAEDELERRREVHGAAVALEAAERARFAEFTDPRDVVSRLDDTHPILLLPVRLETRFTTLPRRPGAAAAAHQLWVRVYPDDCWIDAFDPRLTETEAIDARAYWEGVWQAGGFSDQQRGAWRSLATAHGAGRAGWIADRFRPVSVGAEPTKPHPEDVVLTIPTEAPLPADEGAGRTYWRAAWIADGNATRTAAARHDLETAVGAARAAEIVARYEPTNFSRPLEPGKRKTDVDVQVAFVEFPTVETKPQAWSRAPTMRILPDRFVFIGYRGEAPPRIVSGAPVPASLAAGPDPSLPPAEQIRHDSDGNLIVPDDLLWLTQFDAAEKVGMGLRVDLSDVEAQDGFDRVLVVGLRANADAQHGQDELETLLRHHSGSRTGFGLVRQGLPTNNTEATPSGHARFDDPDDAFSDRQAPLFTPTSGWLDKRDGQWLAEYLGIDPAVLEHVHDAGATDQSAARAMNVALWPATVGYWMETMTAPVFDRDTIEQTRSFFNRYVVGAGAVPAVRIGSQPYGILPATALSRLQWLQREESPFLGADTERRYLRRLYPLLLAVDADRRAQLGEVSFVGKPADPHRTLLDIVGLHAGSVEWSQRYAESIDELFNRLNLRGFGGLILEILASAQRDAATQLLRRLGYLGEELPPLLDLVFWGQQLQLTGGVVEPGPLSEEQPLGAATVGGDNYVRWLIDAASSSLDALYQQDGFVDDRPPQALLYLLLRHALQLGYHDVSIRLYEEAGLFTTADAAAARRDDPFLHIRTAATVSESRYRQLVSVEPAITGVPDERVGQFIGRRLGDLGSAAYLREQVQALERLEPEPTARLERAFADHVDTCAYRLDAWLLGLVNYQLALMRNLRDGDEGAPRQGIYLGAFGWLEELRPEHKALTPVTLEDPDLASEFTGDDEPPLVRDDTNEGYVHAPSLNHAVTAAVLRSGFLSNASRDNRETMAVNLTSERVRSALSMIEGIRAGHGLGDLLGYQFERGLHDRHGLAEVDSVVYKLRKAFPLRADRLSSTKTDEGVPIEAIEARNVLDGLALVDHMHATGNRSYPFGRSDLPSATTAQADAIDAEAERLLDVHDAVADLALAEGVYQAVLGNYDRVASTYDAYARGSFPPEPDVVRTPLDGIGVTHRVAVQLAAGASPTASPLPAVGMTPRAQAEPAVNAWLAKVIPPLDDVGCVVRFRSAGTNGLVEREVTLLDLALQPADLLAVIREEDGQAMGELDDRVTAAAVASFDVRPDTPLEIRYLQTKTVPFSVFELTPLVRYLRRSVTRSRPLQATDLTLTYEARTTQDAQPFVDKVRLDHVRTAMQTLHDDLELYRDALEPQLADLPNHRDDVIAAADDHVAKLAALLARAALFAVPHAGWGFAYDVQRRVFGGVLARAAELAGRWHDRLAEFDGLIARYDDLPAAAGDDERFRLLGNAERTISADVTTPLPATPAAYRTLLVSVRRQAFAAKRSQFVALRTTTRRRVSALLDDVRALLPVSAFDSTEFSLTDLEDELVRFAQDALGLTTTVIAEFRRRLESSEALFLDHDAAAEATARVTALQSAAEALLGEGFSLVPEFPIAVAAADELELALAASRSGELFEHLTAPTGPDAAPLDFPVDSWLYGVARVREKLHDWEQVTMMTGALGRAEPELDALQLPFVPGDRWLGLELAPDQKLDRERLLYTVHFASPFAKGSRQCGLLLDDWTETIPAASADTGVAFHFDRPDTEAPQTMLLVTPSDFRGAWQWDDIVDALHETLELAKRRALEPKHVDESPYATFLPAAVTASQIWQLTIAANLALNNELVLAERDG